MGEPHSRAPRRAGWWWALLLLPLSAGLAAFGITPGTRTETVQLREVVEDVTSQTAVAPAAENADEAEIYRYESRLRRGDTIAAILSRLHVHDADFLSFIRTDRKARNVFRQLVPGRTVRAEVDDDGEVQALSYNASNDTTVRIGRAGDHFWVAEQAPELHRDIVYRSGVIESSLFAATDDAGIPDSIANEITKVFSTDVDFHDDLRKGDTFAVVYEQYSDGNDQIRTGRLLAAEFVNQGERHRVVYYDGDAAPAGYYSEDGRSLRQAFLRSPIEFSRITSGFSASRFHPILHRWRAHTGVDFAAPQGTKVVSTADGEVAFRGTRNGYGNVVELHHRGGYATLYGHLSAFANGLKVGDRVEQGEVIGYVGMTGLATGPHLHYEFKIAGVSQDPQGSKIPVALPVDPRFQPLFRRVTGPLLAGLDLVGGRASPDFE